MASGFLYPLLFLAFSAVALPTSSSNRQAGDSKEMKYDSWNIGAVNKFPIHPSCNATQRRQIELGLGKTILLAAHYFGNSPSIEAIDTYELVVNGDKKNILFRCNNPNSNCQIKGYTGHWGGENRTDKTVICDLSYKTRRSLSTIYTLGYTVSGSETNNFWASDLLHRLYYIPAFGQNWIDHFADGHKEVVEQAKQNTILSTHDSETLQYFALETYTYNIVVPGEGCPGKLYKHGHIEKGNSSQGTATTTRAPSSTTDIPQNCHTHDGGEIHCT